MSPPPITYNPATDIPDLSGKVILVTGGTAGIGQQTVLNLARYGHPSRIFFTGRSESRGAAVAAEAEAAAGPSTEVTFIASDVSSLAAVRRLAETVAAQADRLDVLVANAGVLLVANAPTADGYETAFATNSLGHALLVKLLLPLLRRTGGSKAVGAKTGAAATDARVVFLSSSVNKVAPVLSGIRFDRLAGAGLASHAELVGSPGAWERYGQSKLANALYARGLARRHGGDDDGGPVTFVAVHPGMVMTDMANNVSAWQRTVVRLLEGRALEPDQGSWNTLWAATTDRKNLVSGRLYYPVGEKADKVRHQEDDALAEKLCEWTDKELAKWDAPVQLLDQGSSEPSLRRV